jgi:serine/threonine protein kinase/tetratricopeptide (TPR) repeat protein
LARRVDAICNRFEQAWKEGRPPVLEDYLAEAPEAERAALLRELLPLEAEYRRRRGEEPRPADYGGRFPDLDPDWLAHALAATPAPVESRSQEPQEAQAPGATGPAEGPGTRIGPYKLLQPIGEGGMGAVWLAEQEQPVRRQVALKIIKPGLDSAQVIARFEAERQALALMDHPHIAKVLDAGTTLAGRPYFVMELVKGMPLTRFCDERRLGVRQRLELLIPVCQAVQHAHQKGIIHRDLKPSNILVALYDGQPVPKVIDFGVAKATGPRLTEHTLFTAFGAVVGTLEYMAPEQAEVNQLDIDTRADIYSLGVLLYELLTGSTPLQRGRLKKVALLEVLRQIREQEPPKPSARLSSSETLPSVAALRGCEPAKLTKLVRGELDWIVMKCLEKDRERRYETANGLARDLQRYLTDEPVQACPPSAAYRLRKLARKYRTALLTVAAFVGLLVVAAVVSTWQAFEKDEQQRRAETAEAQATAERDRAVEAERQATTRATEVREVLKFFEDKVLAAARPENQDGGLGIHATILDAVNAAEPKIADAFRERPRVEASIRHTLGRTYSYLGDYQAAIPQHERALALSRSFLGPEHPDTLASMNILAAAYYHAGRIDQAQPLLEEALTKQRARLGPDHPETLKTMGSLANAYQDAGQLDKALPLFEQALAQFKEKLGPDHPDTLVSMNNLAGAYWRLGQADKALPLLKEILIRRQEKLGPDHPDTLTTMHNLATTYEQAGQVDKALPLLEQALAKLKEKVGPDHPHTLTSMQNLAQAYQTAGQPEKALPLFEQVLAKRREKLGPDHPDTLRSMANLAWGYWSAKQLDRSVPLFEQSLQKRKRVLGPDHPDTLTTMANLGVNYRDAGRLPEAITLLEKALRRAQQLPEPRPIRTAWITEELVATYDQAGQFAKSEPFYRDALAQARRQFGQEQPKTVGAMAVLGLNLLRQGQYAAAEPLLRECLTLREKHEPDAWTTFNAQSLLGGALLGQQKYADAEPLLTHGYDGMKQREAKIPPQGKSRLTEALDRLVQLYDTWGKPDQAQKWRAELEKLPKPPEPPKAGWRPPRETSRPRSAFSLLPILGSAKRRGGPRLRTFGGSPCLSSGGARQTGSPENRWDASSTPSPGPDPALAGRPVAQNLLPYAEGPPPTLEPGDPESPERGKECRLTRVPNPFIVATRHG